MTEATLNRDPHGWSAATLGDLIGTGGVFVDGDWVESKDQDPNGDVRLVQLADVGDGRFRDRSARFLTSQKARELRCTFLQRGDILLARMPDPLGRACIFPGDAKPSVTVVDVCIVRSSPIGPDPRWLCWAINSPQFREKVAEQQSGSTRQRVSRKHLAELQLPVAPLAEQRRIVAAIEAQFSRLDAAVAALRRVQANLTRYRAAVLKAACEGRLVPTEADLARREGREYEPASALLGAILKRKRLRWTGEEQERVKAGRYEGPTGTDESELPQVPEGWCWSSLGQCFEVRVGATPSRRVPDYWGGSIPWVSSGEVQFCRIRKTRELITQVGLDNSSTKLNPAGSVLLGMIGEGRTRGQVAILDVAACNNQNCAAIWVSETPTPPEYVYYWLWSQYDTTRRASSGNNQPALNRARVQGMPIPLPPLAEQRRIVAEVERRLSVVQVVEETTAASLKRAEALRQAILRRAFEGKLVPQDPSDEPASVLLERIRASQNGAVAPRRRAKGRRSQTPPLAL